MVTATISRTRIYAHVPDLIYLAGLALIAGLFLWPAWQQPDGLWYAPGAAFSDLTVSHWPNMWFVAQAWRQWGEIPLWRPLIMGGAPFLGNPLAALLYPANWLFLLLPTTLTFHLQYALHIYGAGAALYGLARWGYGRSPAAAFAGGLGYALTPKLIAHLGAGHVGLCQAYAWLPLAVWLLRGAVERRSWKRAVACSAALALAYLADPRVAFYAALALAGYALYRLIGAWRASGGCAALALALCLSPVPFAFLLIGAVQILPTLELMRAATRSALTLAEAGHDSLPLRYLLGYLLADRGGYHEWMTYLGLVSLGLAALALWRGREGERPFWAGLAALALIYALGTNAPLYPLLYRLLPALRWVRVPSRALLLVALAANMLATAGADALWAAEWPPRARRWAQRLAVAGALTCAGLGVGFALLLGREIPASIVALAGIGAAAMGVWALSLRRGVPCPIPQALLLALLTLDLWTVGRSLIELRPADEVFAEGVEAAAYLAAQGGPFRVYSPSYSIPQHVGARLGLEQLDGVDPSQLRWTARYMSLAGGYPLAGYGVTIPYFPHGSEVRSAWREATPDAALLGLLNGCYLAAEFPIEAPDLVLLSRAGGSYLYRNGRCLPRAFLVARAEPVDGWQEAQARLAAGFDPAGGALVEGGPALDGPAGWQAAQVRHRSPNCIVVEAQAQQPSLLVLSEIWHPGWRATVDGVRQPYYRVDGIVRGVYLAAGTHTVAWEYRPASLRWGAALTLGALVAWLVGAIVWRA